MLSTITNTNIDIVRSAVKILMQLNLMEVLDDKTIYMTETNKMLGEASSLHRVRAFRERQKLLKEAEEKEQRNDTVTLPVTELEIEIEKELDIEIDKDKKKIVKEKPSKHRYGAYSHVLLTDDQYSKLKSDFKNHEELITFLDEYIEMKGYKAKNHYLAIRKWVVDAVKERNIKKGETQPQYKSLDEEIEARVKRAREYMEAN